VRTGKIRIFENDEIGPDAVLASACLPFLFQAIEIDGEHYWDGGYMGNPAIYPLIYNCDSRDVLIVHINPIERPDVPKTAGEILNRINEISFNSSLMREMRSVCFVTKLIEEEKILDKTIKRMLIHSIEADDVMQALSVGSKLNADRYLVNKLQCDKLCPKGTTSGTEADAITAKALNDFVQSALDEFSDSSARSASGIAGKAFELKLRTVIASGRNNRSERERSAQRN
jgi:hypothetical protein